MKALTMSLLTIVILYSALTAPAAATPVTWDDPPSTTTVFPSPSPSVVGQPVTFTAYVTDGATGDVVFTDGPAFLASVTLSGGSPDEASYTTTTLTAGSHIIFADYLGDSNYTGSSGSVTQVVESIQTSVVPEPSTTLLLGSGLIGLAGLWRKKFFKSKK